MRRILIISNRSNGPAFARKIAEERPEIQVDLCGYQFSYKDLPNLNLVSQELEIVSIADFVKRHHTDYDFIIALDLFFSFDPIMQALKTAISTPMLILDRQASYLEYSKLTCKKMLNDLQIPTPDYEIVQEDWGVVQDLKKEKFKNSSFMLKLDSTCLGSGIQTRYSDHNDYKTVIPYYRAKFIPSPLFVEEKISGYETSCHFLLNGSSWTYLGSARDYKKLLDGETGQNCSSMGCYSPGLKKDSDIESQLFNYMDRIVKYLLEKKIEYKGIMYLGVMVTNEGIANILEINTRPGNPEFISIVNNIKSKNLLENLWAAYTGGEFSPFELHDQYSVVVNVIKKAVWTHEVRHAKNKSHTEYTVDKEFFVTYHNDIVTANYLFSMLHQEKDLEHAAERIYKELDIRSNTYTFFYRKDIGYLK